MKLHFKRTFVCLILFLVAVQSELNFAENLTQNNKTKDLKSRSTPSQLNKTSLSSQSSSEQPAYDPISNSFFSTQSSLTFDEIDLSHGTVGFHETDIKLPGKNGLNLVIGRNYNSAQFLGEGTSQPFKIRHWGPHAGFGWSFSFAGRAYYRKLVGDLVDDEHLITLSIGGSIRRFYFNNQTQTYSTNVPGDNDVAELVFDDTNEDEITAIKWKTSTGLTYVFSKFFYDASLDSVKDLSIVSVFKGFYLTSIEDGYGNAIRYDYESCGTTVIPTNPLDVARANEGLNSIVGSELGSFYTQFKTGETLRVSKITDSFGREVFFQYEHQRNKSTDLKKDLITSVVAKNTNGNDIEIKYSYTPEGILEKVQVGNHPAKIYGYNHIKTIDGKNQSDRYGFFLTSVTSPLGAETRYSYKNIQLNSGKGENIDIENLGVTSKTIVEDPSDPSSERVDYVFVYSSVLEKNIPSWDSDAISVYIKDIQIINPAGQKPISMKFEMDFLVEKTQGVFKTKNHWTPEKNRIYATESYVADELKVRKTFSYDEYNNPTEINLYKGSENQTIQTVFRTYHNEQTHLGAWENNFRNLVKSTYVLKGGENFNARSFTYNNQGKLLASYKGLNNDELEKSYDYHNNGQLKWQKINGLEGYFELSLPEPVIDNGISALKITRTRKGAGPEFQSHSIVSFYTLAPLKINDINEFESTMTYDGYGRVVTKTAPSGAQKTISYSADLKSVEETISGRTTKAVSDNFGRTVLIDNPPGKDDVKFDYYFGNKLSKKTAVRPDGSEIVLQEIPEYDEYLRAKRSDSLIGSSGMEFDDQNHMSFTTLYKGTEFELISSEKRNELGQRIETKVNALSQDNYQTHYSEFNAFGIPETTNDPRGLTRRYDVDSYGRTTTIYKPYSQGPTSEKVRLEYESYNEIKSETYSDYRYDYLRDAFGRPIVTYAANALKETYTYDEGSENAKGRLSVAANMDSKLTYNYDELGRIKNLTTDILSNSHIPASFHSKRTTIDLDYKPFGGLSTVTFQDQKRFFYDYDNKHNLTTIRYGTKNDNQVMAIYAYNSNGSIQKLTLGNNYSIHYSYQNEVQLTSIEVKDDDDNQKLVQTYAYDERGHISQIDTPSVSKKNTKVTKKYTYNPISELIKTEIITAGNTTTFVNTYDKNGNATHMTLSTDAGSTTLGTSVINPDNDQWLGFGFNDTKNKAYGFSYDGRGNLIQKRRWVGSTWNSTVNYTYNYQNQIINVMDDRYEEALGSYGYDTNRQRIFALSHDYSRSRTTPPTPRTETTIYIWDTAGRIIAEAEPDPNFPDQPEKILFKAKYLYNGNEKIAMIKTDKNGDEKIVYLVNNIQGTPIVGFDEAGTIVFRQSVDEWGKVGSGGVIGMTDEMTFTGKKLDRATGLIYFNQRYYDPELRRFLTEDPAGQYLNPYVYGANSPLMYVDPYGLWSIGFNIGKFGFSVGDKGVSVTAYFVTVGVDLSDGSVSAGVGAQFGGHVDLPGFELGGYTGAGYSHNISHNYGALYANAGTSIGLGGTSYGYGGSWNSMSNEVEFGGDWNMNLNRMYEEYREKVGHDPNMNYGVGVAGDGTVRPRKEGEAFVEGANSIGNPIGKTVSMTWYDPLSWAQWTFNNIFPGREGGYVSTQANKISGQNAMSYVHDTWTRNFSNSSYGALAPAYALVSLPFAQITTYGAHIQSRLR